MRFPNLLFRLALSLAVCALAVAQAANAAVSLTWVPGSSVKLDQILGDKDWATGNPTTSQTITQYHWAGSDLGYSFEDNGKLVFLFGDTISENTSLLKYNAADAFVWSTSTDPEAGLLLNAFTKGNGSLLFVQPPGIAMGPFDTPNSGISLNNQTYLICNSGSDTSLANVHTHDYSVLARFDDKSNTFFTGRTISKLPGGHFVLNSLHVSGTDLLMFGVGEYRASDVYLADLPAANIEGGAGTRYFAGLSNGQPTWTDQEAKAVPVVVDNPLNGPAWPNDNPTVGNPSVTYSPNLGLWLMTYDGGRQKEATTGVYFTYAAAPWGPWSQPQLIFNAVRDHGVGVFIHDPSLNPPGPAGPTIGANDPNTTRGGIYAPFMIERFTKVSGDTLTIYYLLSTWNPYTVVKMRSQFMITR